MKARNIDKRRAFVRRVLEIIAECDQRRAALDEACAESEEPALDAYGAIVGAARAYGLVKGVEPKRIAP